MWKKRGRPKSISSNLKIKKTPQIEAIDLCLQKGIINQEQHSAAMKFRWLYTLRFGAPSLQSNCASINYISSRNLNEKLILKLQKSYRIILKELAYISADNIMLSVCVFNKKYNFIVNNDQLSKKYEKFYKGIKVIQDLLL